MCEGCSGDFAENELDYDNLCEECHNDQGIERAESMRDAYD